MLRVNRDGLTMRTRPLESSAGPKYTPRSVAAIPGFRLLDDRHRPLVLALGKARLQLIAPAPGQSVR